jgi:TIR domain-containing protein
MAELSNALKQKLEHLFEMQGGYVLDFSNASFADFIRTSIHVDPYKGYDGSKATILRQLWHDLNDQAFAKLTLEMLDRWRTNKLVEGHEITAPDQQLFEEATAAVKELTGDRSEPSPVHDTQEYDLAFSFAGEHRTYVEQTVRACQRLGLRVFYDKDASNEWWGKNFIREQRKVYSSSTRYVVPFISNEYVSKPIPMDEFSAAMMTAVKQGDGYILPVLMDDAKVPADLLHPHIHYLRAADYTPEQLADEFARKLGTAKQQGQEPAPIDKVVKDALQLRMPKIVPNTWSKYEELDRLFEYLVTQFRQCAEQLREQGLMCSVRQRGDQLIVRVEGGGETIGGIDIWRGTQMGDDHITWNINWRCASSNSFNGWAVPTFDKERGQAAVDVNDLASMGRNQEELDGSYGGFFKYLWGLLIDQIER